MTRSAARRIAAQAAAAPHAANLDPVVHPSLLGGCTVKMVSLREQGIWYDYANEEAPEGEDAEWMSDIAVVVFDDMKARLDVLGKVGVVTRYDHNKPHLVVVEFEGREVRVCSEEIVPVEATLLANVQVPYSPADAGQGDRFEHISLRLVGEMPNEGAGIGSALGVKVDEARALRNLCPTRALQQGTQPWPPGSATSGSAIYNEQGKIIALLTRGRLFVTTHYRADTSDRII